MVKVKSEQEIKTNYEQSTALVPARFEAGVRSAEWNANALKGQGLYEQQMSDPSILARRSKGIEKVSDEAWRNATINKGKTIIAKRMKDASGKQVAGYRPYREVLMGLELPAKTADPMANLINRGGAVVQALVNKKKELMG